jgi:hypothetical protein
MSERRKITPLDIQARKREAAARDAHTYAIDAKGLAELRGEAK